MITKTVMSRTARQLMLAVLVFTWLLPAQLPVSAAGDTGRLEARVQTPEFQLTANGIEVPGYVRHTAPGAPSLPLHGISFDLPLSGDWELSFESNGSRILDERLFLAAAPTPDLDLNGPVAPQDREVLPSAVPVVDRPDPDIYSVDAFYPASPVLAGEPIQQGDRRVLPVRVFPFQYNPVTQELRYHPDLLVQVQVQRGAEVTEPAAPPGDFYEPTELPGDGVLRIHTKEQGLYRLTYDELLNAGVPVGPSGVRPSTFAVYYKGQQVDIDVTGAGDNSFDEDDLVIFFAVPYDGGRYQDYNVYQFVYGEGVVGQRIGTRTVAVTSVPTTASVITQTLHVEYDRDYRSLYQRPNAADHFFDTQLYPNITTPTASRPYTLALTHPVTSTGALLIRALVHGGVNQAANPDQSVSLRLNGHDIGTYQWDGRTDHLITASVPAIWLDSSPNQISLVADLNQLPGLSYYWISPDWVKVSYPARAIAVNDRLHIEAMLSPVDGLAVSGFTTPFVSVFDVSDPSRPLRLSGVGVQADNSNYMVYWDETEAGASYLLSTQAALRTPGAIERVNLSGWTNADHAYDYVALVGAERYYTGTTTLGSQLATAVQPLLDYRAAEGFNVALIDVQDIYDEWSYGRIDPHAIRSFLSYAYHNWATSPGYVLLVGDGHYDYNRVSSQTLPNLMPPYLAYVDPWWGEVPTDNLYVSVDSLADYLPDMAVGRFPVNSVADVIAMVDKILAYESETLNPTGLWQQRAVYVADDCADPAGNFHALSDFGRLQWLPPAYSAPRVYYDSLSRPTVCPDGTHTVATDLRPAVRAMYDQGMLYMQWFGHGSQTQWGSPAALWRMDPPMLATNTQLPFTVANACLTGYFVWNSPFANQGYPYMQSLAEIMVITPEKASIADLSPSGLHVGSALLTLQRGMHKKLFQERIERAGDVVDAAKWYFFQNSTGYHDVIDTMIFFGDPALKLRYPTGDLSSSTLEVSAAAALPGATLNYTLTVSNSSIFTTTQPSVVVDYPQHLAAVTATGGAINNGDTLTWSLPDLPPGSQQSVAFAVQVNAASAPDNFDLVMPTTVSSQMAPSVALQALTVILTAPDAVASSLVGSRDWLPPGFPFTGTLSLSHADGLPAPSVQATMTLPAEFSAPTWLAASTGSPVYDPGSHTIIWSGDVPAGSPTTLAFRSVISSSLTLSATLPVSATVTYRGSTTSQAIAVELAVPDVNGSGAVTVADIQEVAARWGSLAGSGSYHPRYDLNADDAIDVLDIIIAAEAWN
ncbi:MAG: C25 family cysteine peptidase [Anaerolineae bacterium]